MKLRLAKKISKAILEERAKCYTGYQQLAAVNRCERTKSARRETRFWNALMDALGREGREELVASMQAHENATE